MKKILILVCIIFIQSKSSIFALKEINLKNIIEVKNIKNKYDLSMYYFSSKDYIKALKLLKEIYNRINENSIYKDNALYWIGITYLKMQKTDMALETFKKYVRVSKNKKYFNYAVLNLGDIYFTLGKFRAAEKKYLTALLMLNIEEFKSYIYYQLGICYMNQSKYEMAYESFNIITKNYSNSIENNNALKKINFVKNRININEPVAVNKDSKKKRTIKVSKKKKKFIIQLGVFKNKNGAKTLKSRMKKYNIPTYIIENKGYYKVRIGFFEDLQEAKKFLEDRIKSRKLEGIVLSIS